MADDKKGVIHGASDGGVHGVHPSAASPTFFVAPTTVGEFNNTRLPLIPIACWRVDDIRFAFDSSFVAAEPSADPAGTSNDIRTELQSLISLVQAHPGCPLSIFGHADPVGDDDYNKLLSGRRAMAIYALLIFNSDSGTALKLWRSIAVKENWGSNQHDMMQRFTGLPAGAQDSALMQAYLQKLSPAALKLTKTDFLARGADANGKGDYQGCGEFNPLLLFSKEDQDRYEKVSRGDKKDSSNQSILAERNFANAPNRRVLILMFRKGSRVVPARWPCPTAIEGIAACKTRFWSGKFPGEQRRSNHLSGAERHFEDSQSTFACRFYQRISDSSPCDSVLPPSVKIIPEAAVACPGHIFRLQAVGSPVSGDFEWSVTGADLVDAKGKPAKKGDTVFLRSFKPDNDKASIPAQNATVSVTYLTAQGSAVANLPITIHSVEFVVTNDTVTGGRVSAGGNERAAGVTLWNDPATGLPEMKTDPEVQIKLDPTCPRKDDCATNFQVGWLQTMLTNDRRIRFARALLTWSCPMPIRDVWDPDAQKPFYHEPFVMGFLKDGDKATAHHEDSPSLPAGWQDPRATSPGGALRQIFFSNSFTAWLVVQCIDWAQFDVPGSFVYLRNFDWSMRLDVTVDTTKAVGNRCSPASSPVQIGAVGVGKGRTSPNLADPFFNTSQTSNIIAQPPI